MNKPVIMGHKTYQSIGRCLPGRKNIILTRSQNFVAKDGVIVHSLDEAFYATGDIDEVMIMGGASIYQQSLTRANRLYLTEVHAETKGDIYFPEFDRREWIEIAREDHGANENNDHDHSFVVLERT